MADRRISRQVDCGGVLIGGGAPVSIQSMLNTDPHDYAASERQIDELVECSCEIIRITVPDMESVDTLRRLIKHSTVPIVADIHFDHRLALAAIEAGVSKVRINPGNIGSEDRVQAVAEAAKAHRIPIRIGVNSGSIEKSILEQYGNTAEALVKSALYHVSLLEKYNFDDIVISIKSSDVIKTIDAYRRMAEAVDYPLHLGVTEAGTFTSSAVKSSIAIGALLADGIGDTIRVSVTGDPSEEITIARSILSAVHLRTFGPRIVACPTCGRTKVDLIGTCRKVEERLIGCTKDIKVAIMGCAVNGPGEARDADIGLAGGKNEFLLFARGEIIRKVPADRAVDELIREIDKI